MKKKIIILSIFVALIIIFYFVFFYNKNNINYHTFNIQRANISQSIEAIGEVYAKEQVDVGAQVSGQITKLYVDIGDKVEAGQLIAQIDKDKQQNELEITKAQLESAKANLEAKKIALEIARDQYQREEKLYKAKATSQQSLENAKTTFYTLQANVAELNANVVQLEITLKNAQKDLEYTTIKAPISGIVVNVSVDEGQTVNANQSTPTIVKIANLDEMEIRMEIAEADINKIKPDTMVKFSILNDPNTKFEAKIASIDPANTTQSINNSSSTSSSSSAIYYYARVYVKNTNNFLKIGMSVENSIVIASANNVLVVPTYAIKNDTNGYYVELLKNNQISKSYVELGIRDSINTQITKGVNENDKLILSTSTTATKKATRMF